jgi:hypothetical protein
MKRHGCADCLTYPASCRRLKRYETRPTKATHHPTIYLNKNLTLGHSNGLGRSYPVLGEVGRHNGRMAHGGDGPKREHLAFLALLTFEYTMGRYFSAQVISRRTRVNAEMGHDLVSTMILARLLEYGRRIGSLLSNNTVRFHQLTAGGV